MLRTRLTSRLARATLLFALVVLLAVSAAAEDFWFAAASDTHVRANHDNAILRDAIDRINADERIAFSLWLGDITDHSTPDEMALARRLLRGLKRPWYTVRGNHDVKDGLYEQHFGALNRVIRHEGWAFVLLDSNADADRLVDETRMRWLREQLATIDPATPIVLCCHHPLILGGVVPVVGAPEILDLFAGHNLKAVLAGHLHTNQKHTVDGVLHTTNVCLTDVRQNIDHDPRRGYRVFRCHDGELSLQFVTIREIAAE